MANVRLLGTPYIRGKAMQVGKKIVRYRTDAPLTIGDTVPGNEIPWIEVDGLLIAQKNVLRGVFRQMLANSGLIKADRLLSTAQSTGVGSSVSTTRTGNPANGT